MVNADLAENVAGLRVTQAFRREGTNRARFAGRLFAYRESRLRAQQYIALYFPFVQTLSTVARRWCWCWRWGRCGRAR